ncbi:hypothetical protein HRbin17_00473 [bacterium HR17]|uniref:Uncharacterized protein n=1 Tax=Candidatus Fervidibacter japonicus TaxID=2035412 RepID=A0A2H5X9W4_9BACT|nr:hypothetical protein HRbin17_00473 [bacterium HR17]
MSELFKRLTNAVWAEVLGGAPSAVNSQRHNLQRAHLQILRQLLLQPPSGTPKDARTFVRRESVRLQAAIGKTSPRRDGWRRFVAGASRNDVRG